MTLRRRLRWSMRIALLLFILASAAFLSALTAMRFAIQGREVTMPDLVGSSAAKVQQLLRDRRLGLKVEDRVYSALPVDAVVRQSPMPNTRVKVGQDAHVVLSLGPQKVTIPSVEQSSVRGAQIELLRGGMQTGEVSSLYLPGSPADTVIQQDPAPGTSDVSSPHVNLLVSAGAPTPAYVMPELTGMSLGEAQSKLASVELKAAKLTPTPAAGISRGTVVGQEPPRGQRVDASVLIELKVAE